MSRHKPKQPSKFGNIDDYPGVPEFMPTGSLDSQIIHARKRMGEARWAQLNAEWEA